MKKKCFKCGEILDLSEFYKHKQMADGHLNKCKKCSRKDSSEHREANIDYYLEYDRMRSSYHERKAQREKYKATEKGKERQREGAKIWVERNREKREAHIAVGNALRDGKLSREKCMECGEENAQAHHSDYSKPLNVDWLCIQCHCDLHKKERNLKALGSSELKRGKSKYIAN